MVPQSVQRTNVRHGLSMDSEGLDLSSSGLFLDGRGRELVSPELFPSLEGTFFLKGHGPFTAKSRKLSLEIAVECVLENSNLEQPMISAKSRGTS